MSTEETPENELALLPDDSTFYEAEDDVDDEPYQIALKDRKLVTHPYDFAIRSLNDQINDKSLVLADRFQRRRVWDDTKSSRLIESLLLNVPIPVCYFAELEDGIFSVIDGQQRLTAIYRFLNNEYYLRNLKVLVELNNLRFHQLEEFHQRRIKSRTIRCIVILAESHPDIRFDVFERLNSASFNLNPQELRNCIYRGTLNDLIKDLSSYDKFIKCRNATDIDKRMTDCELILRFFAFHFNMHSYGGNFSRFLDEYQKLGSGFDDQNIIVHRDLFIRVIDDVYYVFNNNSFRKFNEGDGKWESRMNRAIFDVIMLSFAKIKSEIIREKKDEILDKYKIMCSDEIFTWSISQSTKDKVRLSARLNLWKDVLKNIDIEIPEFNIKLGPKEVRGDLL